MMLFWKHFSINQYNLDEEHKDRSWCEVSPRPIECLVLARPLNELKRGGGRAPGGGGVAASGPHHHHQMGMTWFCVTPERPGGTQPLHPPPLPQPATRALLTQPQLSPKLGSPLHTSQPRIARTQLSVFRNMIDHCGGGVPCWLGFRGVGVVPQSSSSSPPPSGVWGWYPSPAPAAHPLHPGRWITLSYSGWGAR